VVASQTPWRVGRAELHPVTVIWQVPDSGIVGALLAAPPWGRGSPPLELPLFLGNGGRIALSLASSRKARVSTSGSPAREVQRGCHCDRLQGREAIYDRLYGVSLPFPYSSQITGCLRELRTQLGKAHFRILYCATPRRTFLLLHGFIKRAPRTLTSAIDLANRRREEYLQRLG